MTSSPSDADSQKRVVLLDSEGFLEFLGLGVVEVESCDVDEESDAASRLIAVVLHDLPTRIAATTDILDVVPDDETTWSEVQRMGIAGIRLGEMVGSPRAFGRASVSTLPRFRIASRTSESLERRVQAAGGALLSFRRIGHGSAIRSGSAAASGWRPSTWRGVWGRPRLEELLGALNVGLDFAGVSGSPSSVLHEVVQGLIVADQPDDPIIGSLRSAIEARPRCMAADHVGFLQDMVGREPLARAEEPGVQGLRRTILNVDPVPRAKLRDDDRIQRNLLRALALLLDISDLDELVQLRSEALPSPDSSGGPSIRRPGIEVHMAAAAIGGAMRHYSGLGMDARPWDAFEQYVVRWMQHVWSSMLDEDSSTPLDSLVLESSSFGRAFSHLAERGTPDDIVVSGDDVPDETVTRVLDQAADRLIQSSTLVLGRTSAIERLGRFDWQDVSSDRDPDPIVAEVEMDERHRGEIELRVSLGPEPASRSEWCDLMKTASGLRFWAVRLRADEVLLVWRHVAEHMNHREVEVALAELFETTGLVNRLRESLAFETGRSDGSEVGVAGTDELSAADSSGEVHSPLESEEVVGLTPQGGARLDAVEASSVDDSDMAEVRPVNSNTDLESSLDDSLGIESAGKAAVESLPGAKDSAKKSPVKKAAKTSVKKSPANNAAKTSVKKSPADKAAKSSAKKLPAKTSATKKLADTKNTTAKSAKKKAGRRTKTKDVQGQTHFGGGG